MNILANCLNVVLPFIWRLFKRVVTICLVGYFSARTVISGVDIKRDGGDSEPVYFYALPDRRWAELPNEVNYYGRENIGGAGCIGTQHNKGFTHC